MANLLTAIRLLLVIPVAWSFADESLLPGWLLLLLILLAIATDYFDGKVARATNTASAKGQLFDHGTDFLFVTTGLAGCALAGVTNPYLPALIVIAFSQYVLDSHYLFHQKDLRMSILGRWNGIFYFAPLLIIACARLGLGQDVSDVLETAASVIAWLLLVSTILSIFDRTIAPLRTSET
ncbi:MAG: hypothetical protein GKR91_20500 [Pseudomonadales bacterium]|nr:hypothetical protein [Pseudomonadales bacterium]